MYNDNNGDEETLIHTRPLPPNHVKVGIDIVFEDCPLPVPIEDEYILTLTNAIGTCVAWPLNLIQIHASVCEFYLYLPLK